MRGLVGEGMTWALGGGLAMELDVSASAFPLKTLGTWVGAIARKAGLDALVTGLFRGGRPGGSDSALAAVGSGGGRWFFGCMAFVDMPR